MPPAAGKLETDMRVKFLADYDYTPSAERRTTFAYFAGQEDTVKRECGEAAIAAGVAQELPAPPKKPLSPAQIKALDGDNDGGAGGSLPKAER